MPITAVGSGRLVIEDAAAATPAVVAEAISLNAGTITNFTQGEIELAAGTAITTISQGGITTITYCQITVTDKTTGSAKSTTITLNATALPGQYTEFLFASSENAGVTSVKVTVPATGNASIIKYVLGGV